jgi:hypothetical protein
MYLVLLVEFGGKGEHQENRLDPKGFPERSHYRKGV